MAALRSRSLCAIFALNILFGIRTFDAAPPVHVGAVARHGVGVIFYLIFNTPVSGAGAYAVPMTYADLMRAGIGRINVLLAGRGVPELLASIFESGVAVVPVLIETSVADFVCHQLQLPRPSDLELERAHAAVLIHPVRSAVMRYSRVARGRFGDGRCVEDLRDYPRVDALVDDVAVGRRQRQDDPADWTVASRVLERMVLAGTLSAFLLAATVPLSELAGNTACPETGALRPWCMAVIGYTTRNTISWSALGIAGMMSGLLTRAWYLISDWQTNKNK